MRRLLTAIVSVIGLLATLATSESAQNPPQARPKPRKMPIEVFTAFEAPMRSGSPGVVAISITRWSTDDEREAVLGILKEAGQPEMIAKLQKLSQVGSIKMPNAMNVAVFYAGSNQLLDGTRHVVIGTDASIGKDRKVQISDYQSGPVRLVDVKARKL